MRLRPTRRLLRVLVVAQVGTGVRPMHHPPKQHTRVNHPQTETEVKIMARNNRSAENDGTQTIEDATPETAPEGAETAQEATDRGNIGTVTVEQDNDEWASVRRSTSNNPVALAVRNAEQGTAYSIVVDDDATKIERVKRMLRAAAQREDVGMSIHPENKPVDGQPGKVKVRFKTGPRDHRTKGTEDAPATGTETTEVAQDTPSE